MIHRGRRPVPAAPPAGSRIHQGLVGARSLIGTRYLEDPELRSEYARDIAPRTAAALLKILGEVFPDPQSRDRPRRLLDLGAGTGAATEAARGYFGEEIAALAVDQVPVAAGVKAGDVTDVAALTRLKAGGSFDLVIAAHVLNELYVGGGAREGWHSAERTANLAKLVSRWCQVLLAPAGTLILIEPALRETSRELLAVRDQLVASGLHIVAPCFFTGPCPALLRERDWCHDAAPPAPGSAGRREPRVDFSYLVVRTSGEASADLTRFRIVSDPLPEKGRLKLFACGLSGRNALVRLDRHGSEPNGALDQLRRGDVAQIARTTFARDGLRVGEDTTVTRLRPGGGS